ncbi:GMC oxidoreductase [Dacryopinax primogenitus]|uniref:GMC oxidoreductase n=1 Tax=Dacryopinax primogenitus (strain DJM 731) TaxID=1858805 RepID=M5FN48_DACPD|nr:GMC oxidoreductase [Dacryopinax primogenitus]EJT96820.1 GMC oxidoreductase [Dacryopinax primogenitus]
MTSTTTPRFAVIEDVRAQTFDYIICGGGTAGLTLAARLSEDASISVLVLEAGKANLDDPLIMVPGAYLQQFGNENYDWAFMTTPQGHCDGRQFMWSRGKSLGGSSACNFMSYMRPPKEDINAWEELGNPGWNWSNFLTYSKRGEGFTPPADKDSPASCHNYDLKAHSGDGELNVGYPNSIMAAEVQLQQALNNAGVKTLEDGCTGTVNGTWMAALTIDPKKRTRSYVTTAFYLPNSDRPNLHILLEAYVAKIRFARDISPESDDNKRKAEGVEFIIQGELYFTSCRLEVILCAGALKSPQILELSGIGPKARLRGIDIPIQVELPGVGENAQEHSLFGMSFELDPGTSWNTYDCLFDPARAAAEMALFHEKQQGLFTMGLATLSYMPLQKVSADAESLIAAQRTKLEREHQDGKFSKGLWEQYQIQLRNLEESAGVDVEYTVFPAFFTFRSKPEPGKSYMTILSVLNHPFSRGSVHAASKICTDNPVIDPHYFEDDFDMKLMMEALKFVRVLRNTEPWKSVIAKEVDPGPEVETEEQMRDYIKQGLSTIYHTCGTCSMLPREKGGVVDPQLKVYGTENVRVVDLSVVPLHVAAHPQVLLSKLRISSNSETTNESDSGAARAYGIQAVD